MNTNQIAGLLIAGCASVLAVTALAQDAEGPLVLYTNDFEDAIEERFVADTGRDIDVIQMSGGELLARIAAETSNPQWDVLIFNGSNALYALDQQEQLKRDLAPPNIENLNVLGEELLPENGAWMPIGVAASCLIIYRSDLVETPPASFADLANAPFEGLVGMADPAVAAPAYPCVSRIFHDMGIEPAQAMFSDIFANGLRVFRTNGPTGRALESGEIAVAFMTSQVSYTLKEDGVPVEIVWPEGGAPASVRGAAVQAATSRPEAADAFISWLLEPATQQYLADTGGSDGLFEATVEGVTRRPDGPPEGMVYAVAPDDFAAANEEAIKTWFADQAVQ